LTAEPRLRAIAKDFAAHYSDLWTSGKAMFVCLNKVTCVRMYNFVQEYWQKEISRIENDIRHATDQQEAQELKRKVAWMKETEMAVVISQEQNEIQLFRKWGLDIMPHRMKMEKRDLEREFKDKNNPFRVVFVCAMWLTGFDVKCLSCLYLDKPLQAHTLMQTIARANRVAEGKNNGLILDYIGIVKELRKALADYTANPGGTGGADPTIDKEELTARLLMLTDTADRFLAKHDFSLQELIAASGFTKLELLLDAANILYQNLEIKKEFSTYANEVKKISKYMDRQDLDEDTQKRKDAIIAILDALQKKRKHVDTTDLEVKIQDIIKDYVQMETVVEEPGARQFDISQINFELLQREFSGVRHKNLLFRDIKEAVEKQLQLLIKSNPARVDFYDRYQKIIEEYNKTQDRAVIEKIFQELMDFVGTLQEEEIRYVREGFKSDEELSLYDLLFKEDLSMKDIQAIKKVASDLLSTIKAKIAEMDHWADKPETQAAINTTIKNMLYAEMPACYESETLNGYQQKIYEYIYNRYGMSA
jgi:type I restriction enzyme, R subunit